MTCFYARIDSPFGPLHMISDAQYLRVLAFDANWPLLRRHYPDLEMAEGAVAAAVRAQLDDYFKGTRRAFTLPLAPRGTAFQRRAWEALGLIPYGQTASYAEQAARIGAPRAVRAIGHANGQNPISIIVPCHRVIAATGALTGYAGGLQTKQALLDHERSRTGP